MKMGNIFNALQGIKSNRVNNILGGWFHFAIAISGTIRFEWHYLSLETPQKRKLNIHETPEIALLLNRELTIS